MSSLHGTIGRLGVALVAALLSRTAPCDGLAVLVEAESLAELGGWSLDTQSVDAMGSPYLLAHGLGEPVADAAGEVALPAAGTWAVWARTHDWVPDWNGEDAARPGRFRVVVDGTPLAATLGIAPADWGWVRTGEFSLASARTVSVSLHDLTGFDGRCDALFFTQDLSATAAPPDGGAALAAWRAAMRGESAPPEREESYDLVVAGGGISGCAAALAAAHEGLRVALVQDRDVFGGNASDEVRVHTQGEQRHWIVSRLGSSAANAQDGFARDDAKRAKYLADEPNVTTFAGWRVGGVVTNAAHEIVAADARDMRTAARLRLRAPLFVDATGDGTVAVLAGAAYRIGRESQEEYGESLAQPLADSCTMGNSMMWRTAATDADTAFPDVPWALSVAGASTATNGGWQWEAGLGPQEDTIRDSEALRDRLLRAVYGSFWNARQNQGALGAAARRARLSWIPFIAGKRESRRIVGDYTVTQHDVENAAWFEDAVGTATWSIDLHFYDTSKWGGQAGWLCATKQIEVGKWHFPYRALCCRDVPNLFLAGRCASFSHVAFGSSRVMNTGGQMGVAVGVAAAICAERGVSPRDVYRDPALTAELQARIGGVWPARDESAAIPAPEDSTTWIDVIVDTDPDFCVGGGTAELSGNWVRSTSSAKRWGPDYWHNGKASSPDVWARFAPVLPEAGPWQLYIIWNGNSSRAKSIPLEIVTAGGVVTNLVDMTTEGLSGKWIPVGTWRFDPATASARLLTEGIEADKYVIADALCWRKRRGETIVDNADGLPSFRAYGNGWPKSSYSEKRYGADYLHSDKKSSSDLWCLFRPDLPEAGDYRVQLAWNSSAERANACRVEIVHADGVTTNLVDMTVQGEEDGGWWTTVGIFRFDAGTAGTVRLLTEGSAGRWVVVDAARFVPFALEPDDADGNGLPDLWERRHFLRLSGTDPDADPDADGLPNVGEWLADTDPHDAASRFSMRGIAPAATARTITLSWPSVEGRTYTVLRAERLGDEFVPYRTGIPATPPENVIELPSDDSDAAFYRIAIDVP